MSVVVQVPMGSSGNAVLENYTIGDVLICKAHRGKLQEIAYLVEKLQADVTYRNQVGLQNALHYYCVCYADGCKVYSRLHSVCTCAIAAMVM